MKKVFSLILLLMMSSVCYAQETIDIDTTGWTQEQINLIHAMSYDILFKFGENASPLKIEKVNDTTYRLYFDSITDEGKALLTKQGIQNNYDAWKIESNQANIDEIDRINNLKISIISKLTTLGLTNEEIDFLFPSINN